MTLKVNDLFLAAFLFTKGIKAKLEYDGGGKVDFLFPESEEIEARSDHPSSFSGFSEPGEAEDLKENENPSKCPESNRDRAQETQ